MWDVPWTDIKADIHTAAVTMWILFMAALMSTSHTLQYIVKREETKIQYKTQIFIKSWGQHDALTWWLIGMLVNVPPQIFISNFLGKNEKMCCFMKRIFPKKKEACYERGTQWHDQFPQGCWLLSQISR